MTLPRDNDPMSGPQKRWQMAAIEQMTDADIDRVLGLRTDGKRCVNAKHHPHVDSDSPLTFDDRLHDPAHWSRCVLVDV